MGAWIEILLIMYATSQKKSLLSWERGLKSEYKVIILSPHYVAPLVGAWIEILFLCHNLDIRRVAPLVGAWIEIALILNFSFAYSSLLSWERGLKLYNSVLNNFVPCRSSRGSVD